MAGTLEGNFGPCSHVETNSLRIAIKRRLWNLHPQLLIEKDLYMVRYSVFLSIAGLLSCYRIIHSRCCHKDMFLVGTAMQIFGAGLYVMFVRRRPQGIFYTKSLPRWIGGMQSIAEAKSKIGHAVTMILQVGLLDKFKDIPLVTGFDLACFAAALLTSSACIFLLSRLNIADPIKPRKGN